MSVGSVGPIYNMQYSTHTNIPISSRAIHYGDGVFETIAVKNGHAEYLTEHLARLKLGCQRLRLAFDDFIVLEGEITNLTQQVSDKAVLKIIVTRDADGRGYYAAADLKAISILTLNPWPEHPEHYKTDGVNVCVCKTPISRNPVLAGIKHLNRLEQVLARSEWDGDEFQEGLMLDGLGDFINQGLALNNTRLILLGAIPAALMALIFDFLLAKFEKSIQIGANKSKSKKANIIIAATILLAMGSFSGKYIYNKYDSPANTVIIGTKNFTEQIILGYMMADLIEAKTELKVQNKFNLGATSICQAAMLKGDIDMYPEYTGTAFMTVLHFSHPGTPEEVFKQVQAAYLKRFNLTWLPPFGFDNSEAIAVKQSFAKQYHLKKISDLLAIEKRLVIGMPAGFLERADGFKGLKKAYGLNFGAVKQMQPGLIYKAIQQGGVNVITAFSTDGRIEAYHLMILNDDKHFYPPYYAAVIIRNNILKKYPQIRAALKPLFGLINNKTMQRLNAEVDVDKAAPQTVARDFLRSHKLL